MLFSYNRFKIPGYSDIILNKVEQNDAQQNNQQFCPLKITSKIVNSPRITLIKSDFVMQKSNSLI